LPNKNTYETSGTLYFIPTMKGERGLIGLDIQDYEELLAFDFKDEEVVLTIKKAEYGAEYSQQIPEYRARAGLYTINMEEMPKFQLDLDFRDIEELRERGFRDLEKVTLLIEKLPYRVPRKPSDDVLNF
jgi:hypothetical protein